MLYLGHSVKPSRSTPYRYAHRGSAVDADPPDPQRRGHLSQHPLSHSAQPQDAGASLLRGTPSHLLAPLVDDPEADQRLTPPPLITLQCTATHCACECRSLVCESHRVRHDEAATAAHRRRLFRQGVLEDGQLRRPSSSSLRAQLDLSGAVGRGGKDHPTSRA
eukprot:CAMPEP_0181218724 /NCGR_PEP_ID=MMETSP1096-20121128/27853_1 /TAXON_ID=156174 ORGANISM="Chrysochromulina ericina, Strain CCMP281" /NCGR_SAMPLE_ID=MMETSP1096 /ASSEMBLY_ACC=CAM_ASM_000453 /LENGTH=162 /DNA_ID=CAMNT_0023310973 /DNA_START=59 /DNA_END=547 /DNA_ORIENTATION=+